MANNQTTAIAVTDETIVKTVANWSDGHLQSFYRGANYDAWKQDAVMAIIQSKELRECMSTEMGRITLLRAIQLNAASGLSLNPQYGEAALVAYNGKKGLTVTHIPMKNGLIKKALKTRMVLKIESGTIYENDEFIIKKTSDGDSYEWTPAIKDRGKPSAYFACVKLADGKTVVEYQTYEQVWEHALKYGKGRVWDDDKKEYKNAFYPESAWGKSFNGQAEKTVIRAVLNNLHLPELEETFAEEDKAMEDMRNVTEETPEHKGTGAEDLETDLKNVTNEAEADTEATENNAETAETEEPAVEKDLF
jgi:recombinational DNA repair protein RecT